MTGLGRTAVFTFPGCRSLCIFSIVKALELTEHLLWGLLAFPVKEYTLHGGVVFMPQATLEFQAQGCVYTFTLSLQNCVFVCHCFRPHVTRGMSIAREI